MTVIRVHELAKKMAVESKDLITVLEKMGIKGKTPSSGLDDKETKSLIEKLKAIRKDKEKDKVKKDKETVGEPVVSREERMKKAAALIGKFSSTLEKPGAKPKPVPIPPMPKPTMPAPPVLPPASQLKPAVAAPPPPPAAPVIPQPQTVAATAQKTAPATTSVRPAQVQPVPRQPGMGPRPSFGARPGGRPSFGSPVLVPSQVPPAMLPAQAPGKGSKKKWQKKSEFEQKQEREFREKPSFKKLPDLKTLPAGKRPHKKDERHGLQTDVADITKPRKKVVKIQEGCTIKEFAEVMGQKVGDVIKKLMTMGVMATQNQTMDMDAAMLFADEYGIKAEIASIETAEDILEEAADTVESMVTRPPVVTIMGHVDHGKTSLLDAIRETNVVSREAGGITQHIGAYQVSLKGRDITFLDTPGHAAFTAMRARGAQVTDIVILVVAADDGVMPQTKEAIAHAKAANVPIIVAINKIDKPEAKPDRVKQELTEFQLIPEAWGGQTIFCEVSAKKKIGLEQLLEMILIQADVLELKANPDKMARGTVIEAKLDKGRGPVATVLVQSGTLKVGDFFVTGAQFGKVRALINDKGERVDRSGPSAPAEVIGFSGVPLAGERFVVLEEERKARQIAEFRQARQRSTEMAAMKKVTLEDLHAQIQDGMVKELNIVIKADVSGSAGAIVDSLEKLSTPAVKLKVIHSSVGAITETDVMLAAASNAIIIGFNVRPEPKGADLAQREGVDIRLYNIIYNAIDDIKAAMEGLLEPTLKEKVLGRAEVRQTFHVSKVGTIAGSYVLEGTMTRQADGVRVLRDNVLVYEGKLHSLKRFKDDVREVQAGYECGLGVENFNDIKVGDVVEAYVMEKVAAKL
ncbi:MAG TPA: translation initiation factor IF-2 [Nitrospirota bacterium]|nr:translation initiation factor IF-2 [Nitrospirota bacterium]